MSRLFPPALWRTLARLTLGGLLLVSGLGPAHAGPITIDFAGMKGADPESRKPVVPESRLTDQFYASHGLRFSSTGGYAALIDLGGGSVGVGGTDPHGLRTFYGPWTVSFFDLNDGTAASTDYVSWLTDSVASGGITSISAYDVHGNYLVSASAYDAGPAWISISRPGIHSVRFYGEGSSAVSLSFNPVNADQHAVPEPGSAALAVLGLAALIRGRRQLKALKR